MATRSLKAFVASLAVVIALFVAAVPANARPGNGHSRGGSGGSGSTTYDPCAPVIAAGGTCYYFGLV